MSSERRQSAKNEVIQRLQEKVRQEKEKLTRECDRTKGRKRKERQKKNINPALFTRTIPSTFSCHPFLCVHLSIPLWVYDDRKGVLTSYS